MWRRCHSGDPAPNIARSGQGPHGHSQLASWVGRRSWSRDEVLVQAITFDSHLLDGLDPVMVVAEPVQVPERGRALFFDGVVVVDLEVAVDVAARDHAFGLELFDPGAES